MSVGTQIMYNRKLKKLTQEDLGDLLGVSYMTIRRWETGKSSPDISELQKISQVLGVPINELLGNDTSSSAVSPAQDKSNVASLRNTGYSLVYERNGERMELPPTAESYAIFRDIALRMSGVATAAV